MLPTGDGAVGVGTGGVTQSHSGVLVLLGRAGAPGTVAPGSATAAAGRPAGCWAGWWAGPRAGSAAVVRGWVDRGWVTAPSRAVGCTGGGGGSAGAAAVAGAATVWSANAVLRPRVTRKYEPIAPQAATRQSTVTATDRRGGRASVSGGTVRHSISEPGNVLSPVEVTSGPSAGSAGRRPRSYLTERQAPRSSARILSHRLINCSPIWSGTLYA
ncbi:hypothetical protein GCM10023107_49990 [Actinoplanes octamycinicus]|uniref:hypothetical protein n=1 Tax=Actinoplanes octamycinicus TaxID=135948 RepID=UPI0031F0B13C